MFYNCCRGYSRVNPRLYDTLDQNSKDKALKEKKRIDNIANEVYKVIRLEALRVSKETNRRYFSTRKIPLSFLNLSKENRSAVVDILKKRGMEDGIKIKVNTTSNQDAKDVIK